MGKIFLYDGLSAADLAARLGLPRVELREQTTSTMDVAHGVAGNGAPAGTLVLANVQTRGRGRSGAKWSAVEGASILCTIVERPSSSAVLEVLSLRIGLELARALDAFSDERISLKWPNDLFVGAGKLGGILVETRWRARAAEWVAVAAGVNVGAPPSDIPNARGLRAGVHRLDVLDAIVPALRRAAVTEGALSDAELDAWRERDWLHGKRISAPLVGVVAGILRTGELVVDTATARQTVRAGSITLEGA